MDAVYPIANKVELITPARFLFNAGATPKVWNEQMLNDEHFKILKYEPKSTKVFPGIDIKGGVTITYRDETKTYSAIKVFTSYPELNSILNKVKDYPSIQSIIVLQVKFNLEALYAEHPEWKVCIGSDGRERRLTSNIFDRVPAFTNERQNPDDIEIFGIEKNKRISKYISSKYIDATHKSLYKYKVLVPEANGSGAIGEVLSTPLIGTPLIGYTFSFIGFGCFETAVEAENCNKYLKSKFARACLGILKITQHNTPSVWRYVPLQDFTSASDIDWSKSIAEIDQQLYAKYRFSPEEIQFIETHVKEMT